MSETEGKELHPSVVALAQDFQEIDGQWAVPPDRLVEHHQQLQAVGSGERDRLITDLIVVATRLEREPVEGKQAGLAQLMALAALLLGGVEAAEQAFEDAGLKTAEARKIIGGEGVQFSDSNQQKPGQAAASLLGVLKTNK